MEPMINREWGLGVEVGESVGCLIEHRPVIEKHHGCTRCVGCDELTKKFINLYMHLLEVRCPECCHSAPICA